VKELLKKWGQLLWQWRRKYALSLRWLWARSLPLLRWCWERGKRQVLEFCLRLSRLLLAGIFVFLCLLFLSLLLYAASSLTHMKCEGADHLLCYWLGVGTKEAVIKRLSIALAGLLSAWAIWSAYRRAEAMQKQVLAMENRLVQERFRDAVQHLGDDSESVRLGGAYALFRLALEEDAFRKQIAEILCAHICAITGAKKYREDFAEKPSMEIHSLMRLLFSTGQDAQAEDSRKAFWKDLRADLSGGYFHGLKLRGAGFQNASLTGAQFQDASLENAKFQGVTSSAGSVLAFEQRIRERVGHDADLSAIVFAGGLGQEQIERWADSLKKGGRVTESAIEYFKRKVGTHVGTEISHELPHGAQGGRYSEAEANRWIEKYNKAMEKAEAKMKAARGDNEVK